MTSFKSFDGTPISVTSEGDGPPLLLVPGGPRDSAYLEDLGGLTRDRTLIRYDARGTGASGIPTDPATYGYPHLARDVEALREHLDLATVDILGHSAGTVVAQAYASAHPDRVSRLILVAPGPQLYGAGGHDAPEILAARADEPWYDDVTAAAAQLFSLPPDAPVEAVTPLLNRYVPAAYGRWDERTRAHAASQETQFAPQAWKGFWPGDADPAAVLAGLRQVSAPVLVLTGGRDALTGTAVGDIAAGHFPNAKHVTLPTAGHYPWVDEPEVFATTVREFLG